jgi:hypothetical protein
LIRGEQRQFMPDAQPGDQGIDRADLNVLMAAAVSQLGRFDVIFDIGRDHRKQRKFLDNRLFR